MNNRFERQETLPSPNRRLGYSREFKDIVRNNPGIIKTALQLTQKAEDEYSPPNIKIGVIGFKWNAQQATFEEIKYKNKVLEPKPFSLGRGVLLVPGQTVRDDNTGLEVTTLAKTKRELRKGLFGQGAIYRVDISTYFKTNLGDQAFFVKKSVSTDNAGYDEFRNSRKTATVLSGLENLTVVQAQLGYDDPHQSWFVSRWENLENAGFFPLNSWFVHYPNNYGKWVEFDDNSLKLKYEDQATKKGKAMQQQIQERLAEEGIEIYDLDNNLFYNPNTDRFFLLDITTDDKRGKGQ